jgi:O-methyltransferase involved in polyketide biosynthesis
MTHPYTGIALSDVSATSLLTLYCHARDYAARRSILHDVESARLWQVLQPGLAGSPDHQVKRLLAGAVPDLAVTYVAMRARRFDRHVGDFLNQSPAGTVVSLGCGLDPRFTRIDNGACRFIDVDLPPVIALKRRLVSETDRYRLLAASVTDPHGLDPLAEYRGQPMLFLAEGLFMYLPEAEVKALVLRLQAQFPGCELVCEVFNRRWLDPRVYWLVRRKMRRQLGIGRDADFRFGLAQSDEMAQWGPGIRLLDDWAFLDEDYRDIGWPKWFAGLEMFRHSQWVVHYRLD